MTGLVGSLAPTSGRVLDHKRLLVCVLLLAMVAFVSTSLLVGGVEGIINIIEWALRSWFERFFPPTVAGYGAISGTVTDAMGNPLTDAVVLVANARGYPWYARTNAQGRYMIADVPAGRYVPIAALEGYEEQVYGGGQRRAVEVPVGSVASNVDFTLRPYAPPPPPPVAEVEIGEPVLLEAGFPEGARAVRQQVNFRHDGVLVDTAYVYEPAEGDGPWPLVWVLYPADAMGWEPASVAFASQGFVLAVISPVPARQFDFDGHARDALALFRLALDGQLTPHADVRRPVALAASFSKPVMMSALRDTDQVYALVSGGSPSDAFLGMAAFNRGEVRLPPPYDRYNFLMAGLGRPDWVPERYLRHSPYYLPRLLPPTLIIHTENDEVIPHEQATRLAEALERADIEHELFIYHDTTHYLDIVNLDPATIDMFYRIIDFWKRHAGRVDE